MTAEPLGEVSANRRLPFAQGTPAATSHRPDGIRDEASALLCFFCVCVLFLRHVRFDLQRRVLDEPHDVSQLMGI